MLPRPAFLGLGLILWALAAIVPAAVLPTTAAAASTCVTPLAGPAMERAGAVFTGIVSASSPTTTSSGKAAFVSTIAVDRVYKGTIVGNSVQVRTTAGGCGLGQLKEDERYVLMVKIKGDDLVAGARSGTAVATDALLARVQDVLGAGTAVGGATVAPEAVFRRVGAVHATPLLRAAAPGVALALVGLLGLIATRRFR